MTCFAKVIGVDISPMLVRRAQQTNIDAANIEFRVFSALDLKEAEAQKKGFGGENVALHMVHTATLKKGGEGAGLANYLVTRREWDKR